MATTIDSVGQIHNYFEKSSERCLSVLSVQYTSTVEKKRSQNPSLSYYLVLSIKKNPPFNPSIYIVKMANNNIVRKQPRNWNLSDLRTVDALQNTDSSRFEMSFESNADSLTIIPPTINEKNDFLEILWQTCYRYFERMPTFLNFSNKTYKTIQVANDGLDELVMDTNGRDSTIADRNEISIEDQNQLISIIDKYKNDITDIDDFAVKLNDQLDRIKWDNLITIIESKDECEGVVRELDQFIDYVECYEEMLNNYDNALMDLVLQIKELEMVDSDRELKLKNQLRLYEALQKYTTALDIDLNIALFITDGSYQSDMAKTNQAADILCQCIRLNMPESFKMVQCFEKQINYCQRLADQFSSKISHLLMSEFEQINTEFMNAATQTNTIAITNHRGVHIRLGKYASILNSLKLISNPTFTTIYTEYTKSISQVYNKQISELIEVCIKRIEEDASLVDNKNNKDSVLKFDSNCMRHLDNFKSIFSQLFEVLLSNITKEVKFCDSTFLSSSSQAGNNNETEPNKSNKPSKLHYIRLRTIVDKIFSGINQIIDNLFEQIFQFYPMYIIQVQNHVYLLSKSTEEKKIGYLKSFIDNWMQSSEKRLYQLRNYLEDIICEKASNKKVKSNQKLLLSGHGVFRDSIRISLYLLRDQGEANRDPKIENLITKQLLKTMYKAIDSVMSENDNELKALPFAVENYYHLNHIMLELRVLPQQRTLTKSRYNQSLQKFVTICYADHLRPLTNFMAGIKASLQQGVSENEIKFQSAFSKVALERVLSNYSQKELRKLVDSFRKTVDKYFTASNLSLIVWGQMQTSFQDTFKEALDLIAKCYSLQAINYDVTLETISNLFTARSVD